MSNNIASIISKKTGIGEVKDYLLLALEYRRKLIGVAKEIPIDLIPSRFRTKKLLLWRRFSAEKS